MEKIGCPPRTPPSRKSLLLSVYFIRLFRFILIIKLLIRIKYPYNSPYSKNAKRKSGYIKNINNGVLGKGERERENRFYKIGFPLAKKKVTPKKSARGVPRAVILRECKWKYNLFPNRRLLREYQLQLFFPRHRPLRVLNLLCGPPV